MQWTRSTMVARSLASGAVLAVMATSVSAQDGDRQRRFLTGPLHLEDMGSFFIGGVPKVTNYNQPSRDTLPDGTLAPSQIIIGQMYVQFYIPGEQHRTGKSRGAWPVIHVHGSSHTGAALESTPDEREGWAPYFVRHGIPTYVVDQAGRARSGFDQSVINEGEALITGGDVEAGTALIPEFPRISDNRAWLAWFGHLIEGTSILDGRLIRHGDPGDPPTDDTLHADGYLPKFPIPPVPNSVDPRVVRREGAIGPEPLGPHRYYALEYYKQLVPNGEVTLPGSICEACDPQEISPANTWTPRALALLVERLGGAIVATHSQSGNMGHHMTRILKERGNQDLLKALITIEGGCSLAGAGLTAADFDNIPYLAVSGDYRLGTSEAVCADTAVPAINASPTRTATPARFLELDEIGRPVFNGTTHMMMLDTHNLEVADVILNWVRDNVPRRGRRS